jgi:hypothetical protein
MLCHQLQDEQEATYLVVFSLLLNHIHDILLLVSRCRRHVTPHKPDALVFCLYSSEMTARWPLGFLCDGSIAEAFTETLSVAEARDLRSK